MHVKFLAIWWLMVNPIETRLGSTKCGKFLLPWDQYGGVETLAAERNCMKMIPYLLGLRADDVIWSAVLPLPSVILLFEKKKDEINDGNQYKIKLECLLNVWADFCQALPWQRSKGWTHLTYRNSLQIWMKSCWKFQRLTVNRPFKTFKNPYGCGIPRPPCHLVRSRVKMRCVDLLLQLLWPSGSRLTARTD